MCCIDIQSPSSVAKLLLRIGFGGALLLFGVAHYADVSAFAKFVSTDLGVLSALGTLWAYVLPLLMIVGGGLIIAHYRLDIAAWCAGIALVSIALGMPLKAILGSQGLDAVAPSVTNALLWLLIYVIAIKSMSCASSVPTEQAKEGHCCKSC